MSKYRLIKEYPGSPALNTIVEKFKNSSFYQIENRSTVVINLHVEDNPEYWEKIANIYYLVFTKEETSFKCWELYMTSSCTYDTDYKKYFTSRQDAENYILLNKPCLSYEDLYLNFEGIMSNKSPRVFLKVYLNDLMNLIKSKI